MLLLPDAKRLSIDIDIILPEKPKNIENIFKSITEEAVFTRFEENERVTRSKIDKAHYKFYYQPITSTRVREEYILLDILYESNPYGKQLSDTSINSSFLKISGKDTKVSIPTYEAILGDKLTAFAPNTNGVPYGREKEIEVIKQLYDIGLLFNLVENVSHIIQVFETIGKRELKYRELELPLSDIVDDIYETSLCICTRGMDGKGDFTELQTGIQNIVSYIFSESFFIDKAITAASKAAYLSVLLRNGTDTIMRYKDITDIDGMLIDQPFCTRLNKLKKSNPEAFYYWNQTVKLMENNQ